MKATRATLEKQATIQVQDQATCRHHWVIESPTGPISRGVCKVCGAVKEFQNYQFDFSWEDAVPPQIGAGPSRGAADVGEGEEEEAA